MVSGNSFGSLFLLALVAAALLVAPAAAQTPSSPVPSGSGSQEPITQGQPGPAAQPPAAAPAQPPVAQPQVPHLANLGPGQPNEHPLMPALRWARDGIGNIEKLEDYSATMIKRERIDGEVGEPEYMFVKIRHRPFSVYMRFLAPDGKKGREVIYIDGQNDGNILAHSTGLQRALIGVVELAPTGLIAMQDNRYPITEIGLLNMVRRLIEVGEQDTKYGECEVKFFKGAKINDRVCTCIQVVHPVPRRNFLFHVARIFVDDEHNVPLRYEAYDWPEEPGGAPRLLEEYTYLNLKFNNGFSDADFDISNPGYDYP
jgi:hypothetical protein